MSQKSTKKFINEIYSKRPKKNYPTNKTDVYYIDLWSLNKFDIKDNGPENSKGYRYVLLVIDSFSKQGFTLPLKNKNAQTLTNSFENVLISSQKFPTLVQTDRGKEYITTFIKI